MSEYKRPQNEAEFRKNFKQKKPLMNETEAYYESARCLFCYDAPCTIACPTHIDIPLFIKQIQTQNLVGSAKTIFESNWLGNACAVVCPTAVLCEGACVLNHQDVPPIQIGRLQNYATSNLINSDKTTFKAANSNGKKVAVVGAGPAGLACACELRTLGYEVDIYEAKDKASGLTVYGIAPYKITNEEVLKEVEYLQNKLGFGIKYKQAVNTKKQIRDLEKNYDAIFLGVGLGESSMLNLDGEDTKGVIGAIEFIEELRMKRHLTKIPDKVLVIGGGNTAMDVASEAARMGVRKIVLAYRRSKKEMGAYAFEYDLAISAGVDSLFNVAPIGIVGENKLEGIKFAKTEVIDGRVHIIENNTFIVRCDMLINATGQAKKASFYKLIDNLATDSKTKIIVDKDSFQTSNKKYFAGGDAVNGGAEVVNAAYDGKMAARGIHKYLNQ